MLNFNNEVLSPSTLSQKAILIEEVKFTDVNGVAVILPAGTEIIVDSLENIASFDDYCFDIQEHEYLIQEKVSETKSSQAMLVKTVEFDDWNGEKVIIPSGVTVEVDVENGIGRFADYCFDLNKNEYLIIQ